MRYIRSSSLSPILSYANYGGSIRERNDGGDKGVEQIRYYSIKEKERIAVGVVFNNEPYSVGIYLIVPCPCGNVHLYVLKLYL